MESEKREEELRMQKRYNEDKLIEEIKFQMCKKLEQKIQIKQKMINQIERTWLLMRSGRNELLPSSKEYSLTGHSFGTSLKLKSTQQIFHKS